MAGTLTVQTTTLDQTHPIANANIIITDNMGKVLHQGKTDANGNSPMFTLPAPPVENTLNPRAGTSAFSTYNVAVSAAGFNPIRINGVQIVNDGSVLPVVMHPQPRGGAVPETFTIAPITASQPTGPQNKMGARQTPANRLAGPVCLPENIRVHLGTPSDETARNVTVPFIDYVKNSASSEIYSTWPQESLDANIIAIMTFAINRTYTEWYPSRGYNFDITNSTAYDQAYVDGRNIFQTISDRVDALFGTYARKVGFQNPYFTEYCNGTTSTCPGMSQWGTVPLAQQGMSALQILQRYYGNDLELVKTDCTTGTGSSYPGTALQIGSNGENVKRIQDFLNRIRADYPAIPIIASPNGYFGTDTANAVRKFQEIFHVGYPDGIVGPATWNKITQIYTGITKLSELNGEGERVGLSPNPPTSTISQGAQGGDVEELQYILGVLSSFYSDIPKFIRDSDFGPATRNAVVAFQRMAGLTPDGVVGPATWQALYRYYRGLGDQIPTQPTFPSNPEQDIPVYPGSPLREGSSGTLVRSLQTYLNDVGKDYPSIPHVNEDGVFGPATRRAVVEFQRLFGLPQDGIVGRATWDRIIEEYLRESGGVGIEPTEPEPIEPGTPPMAPAYPGTPIRRGSRGEAVRQIQICLGFKPADGVFGTRTEAAVRAFQHNRGLKIDGIVGPATWRAIIDACGTISQPPTAPATPPAYPGSLIRVGSRGESVKLIQRQLGVTPDGIFGANTRAAVVAFQYQHGLTPDGIVGPATWNALFNP